MENKLHNADDPVLRGSVSPRPFGAWPGAFTAPACLNELVCDDNGSPRDYRIIDVNTGFESLTGVPRDRVAGRLMSELYGPAPGPELVEFAHVTTAGTTASLDMCLGNRACRVTALPAGQRRFVTVFDDRRPADHGVDYHEFFDLAPDYCFVVAADGLIRDANPAACAALGRAREELAGRPVLSVYAPEWQAHGHKLVERWRRSGRLDNEEMAIVSADGSRRIVLLSVRAARTAACSSRSWSSAT